MMSLHSPGAVFCPGGSLQIAAAAGGRILTLAQFADCSNILVPALENWTNCCPTVHCHANCLCSGRLRTNCDVTAQTAGSLQFATPQSGFGVDNLETAPTCLCTMQTAWQFTDCSLHTSSESSLLTISSRAVYCCQFVEKEQYTAASLCRSVCVQNVSL